MASWLVLERRLNLEDESGVGRGREAGKLLLGPLDPTRGVRRMIAALLPELWRKLRRRPGGAPYS